MRERTARGILALAVLSYIAVLVWFSPLDVQDYPNHLARALIMEDLIFQHGAEFGQIYQFHFLFTPYVLGDLLLATVVHLFGINAAAIIWMLLTFLSLPLSLFAYLRARQTSAEVTILMLLISLYLSTDTFFIMGFTEFRLSIALVFVALALVELLRRQWSAGRYLAFAVIVVSTYLTHLAAIAFIAAAMGAAAVWRALLRKARIGREILLMAPLVSVMIWHVFGALHYRQPQDQIVDVTTWGTVTDKVLNLVWDFIRYNPAQDCVLLAMFAAFVLFALRDRQGWGREVFFRPQVLEPWGYAVVFLGVYFALPYEQAEASYIDVRALALVPLFTILGLLNLPLRQPGAVARTNFAATGLAAALALANLAYLAHHFREDNAWMAQYRAVVANIPRHAAVFPIYTATHQRSIYPKLHAAAFAVIERHAVIPYLFSGDLGSPMKYFRYAHRPYAPNELWYRASQDSKTDWRQVHDSYQYLLIMKPFGPSRIPLKTRTVAENDAAALLAVQ
jgi:hypothetical protein